MSTTPTKNWTLVDIVPGDGRCANPSCHAHLKWLHVLRQGDEEIIVGSECLRSYTHTCDPELAKSVIVGGWRRKGAYWYKRRGEIVYGFGQRQGAKNRYLQLGDRRVLLGKVQAIVWWAGVCTSVVEADWIFVKPTFDTEDDAKRYLAVHAEELRTARLARTPVDDEAGEVL